MASSSSDKPFGRTLTKQTSIFDKDAFSRISEVQEAADRAWNNTTSSSFMTKGKFGRSSFYSASSSTRTAYSTTKTTSISSKSASTKSTAKSVKKISSKHNITRLTTAKSSAEMTADAQTEGDHDKRNEIEKRIELPTSSHHHIDASEFFKAKFPQDMDGDDFFRSASSRFTMRNLKSTSGWNVEFDDGASLFPDFFPKNDAATKLSFEATWRAVSPTREIGLAKQAIKNYSWEDDEKRSKNQNSDKEIVNSWMQFFGHVNSVKDG